MAITKTIYTKTAAGIAELFSKNFPKIENYVKYLTNRNNIDHTVFPKTNTSMFSFFYFHNKYAKAVNCNIRDFYNVVDIWNVWTTTCCNSVGFCRGIQFVEELCTLSKNIHIKNAEIIVHT